MTQSGRGRIRRLALAAAVSSIGDWAASIALSLAIYGQTHSTIWLSASFFFVQVARGLLAPVAGAMADRFDRRSLLVVSELLGAATYALMVFTTAPAWLIAFGTVAALFALPAGPAAGASVPNLIGEDGLSWANGPIAAALRTGTFIGPAIGGVLFAALGAGAVFGLNAVSFVASAAVLSRIRGSFRASGPEPEREGGVWAGLRFIAASPVLVALAIVGAVSFIAAEISTVAELPLVHEFGVGALGYGIANTAWGAGGVLGAIVAARVVRRRHEPAAAVYGILFFGIFLGLIGLAPVFVFVPICFFLFAFSDPFSYVGFGGIIQRGTPDAIR